jgi:hypothetical protein
MKFSDPAYYFYRGIRMEDGSFYIDGALGVNDRLVHRGILLISG